MAVVTEVFQGEFNISEQGVQALTDLLTKLDAVAKKTAASLGKIKFATPQVDTSSLEKSAESVKKAGKAAKETVSEIYDPIKVITPQTSQLIEELSRQFDEVRDRGGAAAISVNDRFRGAQLAITGTGNRLQGLREILAGTTSSTNGFVRVLDSVIKRNDPLASLSNNLQKNIAGIAETASVGTRALATQGDILRRVVTEEFKDSTVAMDEFNKQTTRVNSSFKQIFVTASRGGDISTGLIRARIEVRGLEDEYQLLTSRGIIKAGSESDKLFQKMIADARTTESRLQAMNQRYQGTKKEIAAAKVKQDEMTASGKKQVTVFNQIQIKLSNLFNIFRSGKTDINQATTSLNKMETQIKQTSQTAGLFKNVFLGAFSGVALGSQIPFILDAIRDKFIGAIQAASNAEEEMSKFFVVFQDEGDKTGHVLAENVIGVLDGIAETLGRSKFQLRAIAATFQDTFVPLGFGREAAAQLSVGLTTLTEDLSSFYNLTEKEVSDSISSFLVGNYENARKFGVVVNDAALDAELLKMGVEGGTEAVDQQTKTMTALKLLLQGTADAQGDATLTAQGFANQMRNIQGRALDASIAFGQKLLPLLNPLLALFIRLSDEVGPKVAALFNNFSAFIDPIAQSITNVLSSGSVDEIFSSLIAAVQNGVIGMLDSLNSFLPLAAEWAYNWGLEIYNGLIEMADSLITEAMNYIGSIFQSFLMGQSPPAEGPLRDIDTWGGQLIDTFTGSMSKVDTDPLKQGLGAIRDVFSSFDLGAATADVLAIEQQIIDAEAKGFVPAELRKQLQLAKDKVTLLEQQGQLQEQVNEAQEKGVELGTKGAEAKGGGAGGGSADRAEPKERKTIEKKTALEIKDEALRILDQQLKDGVIKYEDYASDRLKIEEKFYQDTAEEGGQANQETIDNIKHFQDEVQRLQDADKKEKKGKGKGGIGLADLGLSVEDFLPNPVDLQNKVTEGVSKIADKVTVSFTKKIDEAKVKISSKLAEVFTSAFDRIRTFVTGLTPDQIFPFSIVVGIFAAPVINKIFGFFEGIIPFIGRMITSMGGLGKIFLGLGKTLLKFSIAGFIVYSLIVRWDDVVATATQLFDSLKKSIGQTITNVQEFFKVLKESGLGEKIVSKFGSAFSKLGLVVTQIGGLIQLVVKKLVKILVVEFIAKIIEFSNAVVENFGGVEAFTKSLGYALLELATTADNVAGVLINALGALNTGDFDRFLKEIRSIPAVISASLGTGLITSFSKTLFESIGKAFQNLIGGLPPEVQTVFRDIAAGFQAFFSQGRLGGEFANLLVQLKELFITLIPTIKNVAIVFGVIAAVVINIVVSALQGLVAALPFVELALAGVIRFITGAIDLFTGFALLVQAVWKAATGDTEAARVLFDQAFSNIAAGITGIIGGILQTIAATGAGILAFVVSFVGSFLANILMFIPGYESLGLTIRNFTTATLLTIQELLTQALTIFSGLSNQLRVILPALFNFILQKAGEFVIGIVQFFTNLYNNLVGESIIPDMVTAIVAEFLRLAVDGVQAVVTFISEVQRVFSDAKAKFISIGLNIIKGLLEGINKNKDKVIEVLKALASDAVAAAASFLGIHSPSIKFLELGISIIEGLVAGINKETPTVEDAIGAARDTLEDFFDGLNIEGSKADLALRSLTTIFRQNADEILNATNRAAKFQEIIERSGISFAFMAEGGGADIFGGKQGALGIFIEAFDKLREEQLSSFAKDQLKLLDKVQESIGLIMEPFNQQLFNIRDTANRARIELQEMFNRDITDEEVERMAKAFEGVPIEQLSAQQRLILRNYILQQKLTGALEEEEAVRAKLAEFGNLAEIIAEIKAQAGLGEQQQAEAEQAGNEIISALGLGIDAGVDDVLASLAGVSQDIIDKLKLALGIASPSKITMGFGQNLMHGLRDGIFSNLAMVETAMTAVNSTIASGIDLRTLTDIPDLAVAGAAANAQDIALAGNGSSQGNQFYITNNIGSEMDLALVERRITASIMRSIN